MRTSRSERRCDMGVTKEPQSRSIGRQKGPEAVCREFAHDLDLVFLRLPKVSFAESINILRQIEAKRVAQLSNHPELALELRRRTAELSLEQALLHGCSLRQCRKWLARAEELGWSIIDQKLHFHLIYARGMIARGHYRTAGIFAKRCIADIKQELGRIEEQPRRRGRKFFLDWSAFFSAVLTEIERSEIEGNSSRWDVGGRFVRTDYQGKE